MGGGGTTKAVYCSSFGSACPGFRFPFRLLCLTFAFDGQPRTSSKLALASASPNTFRYPLTLPPLFSAAADPLAPLVPLLVHACQKSSGALSCEDDNKGRICSVPIVTFV